MLWGDFVITSASLSCSSVQPGRRERSSRKTYREHVPLDAEVADLLNAVDSAIPHEGNNFDGIIGYEGRFDNPNGVDSCATVAGLQKQ